jgi:hypothetical protein
MGVQPTATLLLHFRSANIHAVLERWPARLHQPKLHAGKSIDENTGEDCVTLCAFDTTVLL